MIKKFGNWGKTYSGRYALYGAAIGLSFPFGAFVFESLLHNIPISISSLIDRHVNHPLFWFIDTAPLVLGYMAGLAGKREDRLVELTKYLDKEVKENLFEINQQKLFFEALFKNIPVAVVIFDDENKILDCNPAFENMFFHKREDVINKKLDPLVSTADTIQEASKFSLLLKSGQTIQGIGTRKRKDGSLLEAEVRGVPVYLEGAQINSLAIYNDLTEQKKLESQLKNALSKMEVLATVDPLTGLPNRRAITEHLQSELSRAERTGESIALALVDMDHLKNINDKYGHLIGDNAIRLVGETLNKVCRLYDCVGRWGGDEFLVILSNVKRDIANEIIERLKNRINETMLILPDGTKINLSVSIGISCCAPMVDQKVSAEEFLQQADEALYRSKGKKKANT